MYRDGVKRKGDKISMGLFTVKYVVYNVYKNEVEH